jgi:hypothetical protein
MAFRTPEKNPNRRSFIKAAAVLLFAARVSDNRITGRLVALVTPARNNKEPPPLRLRRRRFFVTQSNGR